MRKATVARVSGGASSDNHSQASLFDIFLGVGDDINGIRVRQALIQSTLTAYENRGHSPVQELLSPHKRNTD